MNEIDIQAVFHVLDKNSISYHYSGRDNLKLTHVKSLDKICQGALSFCRGAQQHEFISSVPSNSLLIISNNTLLDKSCHGNYIQVENPDLAFSVLASLFLDSSLPSIHPTASIASGANIGRNVQIGAFVRIHDSVVIHDDVIIGDGCVLSNVTIGQGSHIFPGVKIGSSGLGSVRNDDGEWFEFPHFGRVIIGTGVIIQDNSVVARGSLNDTVIEDGVRIGPLTWVAHGAFLHKHCFIGQSVTIAGSSSIGEGAIIWGHASIRDGLKIGSKAVIGMGSVVLMNVPDRQTWFGNPARCK